MSNFKYVLKNENLQKTVIKVGETKIGEDFLLIAGPCSVEDINQVEEIAQSVKKSGANVLRGGAYKPRTSPYSFRGLGLQGLEYLRYAGQKVGLPIITEVCDTRDVETVAYYSDILQIGTRNMQNFSLLVEVGKTNRPVLLKRGIYSTIDEFLNSAEYIMNEGNQNVILCERGIRTVETEYTRNTLDLSTVALLKQITHLPVIVDPSHATGRADLIEPMCLSSVMAGCDGLEIEVHNSPDKALSDSEQQITPEEFSKMSTKIFKTVEFKKNL